MLQLELLSTFCLKINYVDNLHKILKAMESMKSTYVYNFSDHLVNLMEIHCAYLIHIFKAWLGSLTVKTCF